MPSPFPGMNPYLEQSAVWQDFHGGFIYELRAMLVRQVAPRYIVRVEEHVYPHELPDGLVRPLGRPDFGVLGRPSDVATAVAVVAALATITIGIQVDEVRVRSVEVRDRQSNRLVTVLEVLSPSNKYAGPDREQYLLKRLELLRAGVNFVELDLLRGGPRLVTGLPACDYYAMVARTAEMPQAGVWAFRLTDPLPSIPVPLRPGEPEPRLDLKAALDAEYDRGGFGGFAYSSDPEPMLTAEQAAWAAGFVPRPAG